MVDSLKMLTQHVTAMRKVTSMLRIIKKGIKNKTANIVMLLFKSMVQLHLEHFVQL